LYQVTVILVCANETAAAAIVNIVKFYNFIADQRIWLKLVSRCTMQPGNL